MTLTLERPPRTDATSWASVLIENVGDRGVRWAGGGCGDPGGIFIDLADVFAAGRSDWPNRLARFKREALGPAHSNGFQTIGYEAEARVGTNMACTADLRIETLAAHDDLALRAAWDGLFEGAPVPTGPATVEAAFPMIGIEGDVAADDFDSHAVSVSVRTAIVGEAGATLLAPALAIDAALADPQFAAWINEGVDGDWLNADVARIGDTWQIGLFKRTEAYHGVIIDAAGRVVGHR